jgi:uncharacterized membrane protein YkvA (DUF1232 family)
MANKKAESTSKSMESEATPEEVVNSPAFQQAKNRAEVYARDPEKAKKLVDQAMNKAKRINKGPLEEVWGYLTGLIRMTRAYFTRQYTGVSWKSIVLVIAGLIYFVSPIDFFPDVIPVIGHIDDAMVVAFVARQIKVDLDDFMAWEISRQVEEIVESAESEESEK